MQMHKMYTTRCTLTAAASVDQLCENTSQLMQALLWCMQCHSWLSTNCAQPGSNSKLGESTSASLRHMCDAWHPIATATCNVQLASRPNCCACNSYSDVTVNASPAYACAYIHLYNHTMDMSTP